MQSGYDFQKKFNYNPKTAAVLVQAINATEGLGMQQILKILIF